MIPFLGIGGGEVDNRHAGLPHVPLPNVAVWTLEEVAFFLPDGEQRGSLSDVWIDPSTDFEASIVKPFEHAFGIGENFWIPFEIAPSEAAHPIAVVVEHGERDAAVLHTLNEGVDGFLVVVGREGSGEPKSE